MLKIGFDYKKMMIVEVGDNYMVFMIECNVVGRVKFFLVDFFEVKFVKEFVIVIEELDVVILGV